MSEQRIKLIVGLGNVGSEYEGTRHNSGFRCVDALAERFGFNWHSKPKFQANLAEGTHDGTRIILVKPTTYYNLSGEAVQAIAQFYHLNVEDILVIHDELDLPFGTLRTRVEGGDAGNNGIKSLLSHLGRAFARIRIGIANDERAQRDAADFVLERFSSTEQQQLLQLTAQVVALAQDFIADDKNFLSTSIKPLEK
jgi:PTH1 family peptidyl-tRNA hydrolase